MLAAILCNLYRLEASGPAHGIGPTSQGRATAATSWNQNWATDYGPDVDRARKAKPEEVQKAIDTIAAAEDLPLYFEQAQDIVERRSLAGQLQQDDESLLAVMTAYYAFLRWQREDDETAIIALLM